MIRVPHRLRAGFSVAVLLCGVLTQAQAPAPAPTAEQAPATQNAQSAAITEDELKQQFAGKTFYLRSGFLDNSLEFDEHGRLTRPSPTGSYTLCLIEIDKVRLAKHRVELTGVRYGLHFLGALPGGNSASAVDRVRITPKKKLVRISIDREQVVKLKKKKEEKSGRAPDEAAAQPARAASDAPPQDPASATEAPADAESVTSTTSPAHARKVLEDALDAIFAPSLDARMIDTLPDFWKLYYRSAAAGADYAPADPAVLHVLQVDRKPRLTAPVEPTSNEYAQGAGVAGMALYHVVIGPGGKPAAVVVGRPIGFGLDESAAASIYEATFEPALKDGRPVPVLVDLLVQFRIYSNRTSQPAHAETAAAPAAPRLPGPYSLQQP